MTMISSIYDFLIDELGPCPKPGGGVHSYLFSAALTLKGVCDEVTAYDVIAKAVECCGREVPDREIRDAIRHGFNAEVKTDALKWPQKNQGGINEIARTGLTLDQLRANSLINPDTVMPAQVLDTLFPGDPERVLLCIGTDTNNAATRTKAMQMHAAPNVQFIVPNPMRAYKGLTKDGEPSERCLDNTGPRRFLIVECDPMKWADLPPETQAAFGTEGNYIRAKKDEACAILWHLAETEPEIPLVLVVDSGNRSAHGWFLVANRNEEDVIRFFRYAVSLGADRATWNRCQFVRMPGGLRDNGQRQHIIYFNPQPLQAR